MKTFYFTFGISQGLLSNRYIKIEATDLNSARQIMFDTFGTKWAMSYDKLEAFSPVKYDMKEVIL